MPKTEHPVQEGPNATAENPTSSPAPPATPGLQPSAAIPTRVMLIEDNPGDTRLILEMLREAGDSQFLVDCADRLSAGLEKLKAQTPDAVLLDLNLPDSRGVATFSQLYARFPQVPIVVLTGLSNEDIGVQAVRAGAQDYLVKGVISGNVLVRVLRYGIERKYAEAEHLRLVTAIEQAAEAVVITDLEARIEYVNPAFTRATGYGRDEVAGRSTRLLKSGRHPLEFYRRMWEIILAGNNWHGEIVNRRKDGSLYTEEMTIAPVRDTSGVITNFIAIKQDVTERKQAEEAARRRELEYRGLFEHMSEGLAYCRMIVEDGRGWDFIYVTVNSAFERLTGLKNVTGRRVTEVIPGIEKSDPGLLETYARVALTGIPEKFEVFVEALGMWFSISAYCPETGFFVAVFDVITERKRAEEVIRQLNANLEQRVARRTAELQDAIQALQREAADRRLAEEAIERLQLETERILNSAGDGIARLDLDGRCTFANPAASRLLGYTRDELMGRELHALLRHALPDGQPCAPEDCGIFAALKRGVTRQAENQILYRKDGAAVPFDSVTTPIIEGDRIVGAVVTFRDVSERWAVEKMKDEFVSVVSHELRTPLTAVRGALGLLATDAYAAQPDRARRLLEITVKNTDRLTQLINDILESQRLEACEVGLQRKRCLASELMMQAADLMRPMAETAGVYLETASQPAPLLADPDAILQVLTNLLSNAIKYSPAGSTVRMAAEQGHEVAVFRVRDEGQGVPEENLESIFERFHPVDATDARRRGGTGLGLFICRKIVQRHGGRIWAESQLGRGSTFAFTLPLEPPEEIAQTITGSGREPRPAPPEPGASG